MDKGTIGILFGILFIVGFSLYYYGGYVPFSNEKVYYHTYTVITHTSTGKFGEPITYETYIATYTRPADFRTISLQFIMESGSGVSQYNNHLAYSFNRDDSVISVFIRYGAPDFHCGTKVYPDAFEKRMIMKKSGNEYVATIINNGIDTSSISGSSAASLYSLYSSRIMDVWSQLNFAPIMTITIPPRTYYVSIPPDSYAKIYQDVDLPIHAQIVLPTPWTVRTRSTYVVYPSGTYTGVLWFKVWGDSETVVTTTVTRTLS